MSKLITSWQNYYTCADCSYLLHRDVINTILFIQIHWFSESLIEPILQTICDFIINPLCNPFPFWWWWWAYKTVFSVYLFEHLYMLFSLGDAPIRLNIQLAWSGLNEGDRRYLYWKCFSLRENHFYHQPKESLIEKLRTAKKDAMYNGLECYKRYKKEKEEKEKQEKEKQEKEKRGKEKQEKEKQEKEKQKKDKQKKKMEKDEDLKKSLAEYTKKLIIAKRDTHILEYYKLVKDQLKKEKQEKETQKGEKQEKEEQEKGNQKNCMHVQKKLEKEEDLNKSLAKNTNKLNKWEQMFEDWSSLKSKEMAKLVSEETNVEEQKSELCKQRERVWDEIVRLQVENKELAQKIAESETMKNKLIKKRHKKEASTNERLYEHKIEKAKILDSIQRIKFELKSLQDYDAKDIEPKTESKEDQKAERTHQLAIEIEEKERDLECPVCFELCTKPIFMCDLSHQICKQCRPKMKVCPQCREAYKKYKKRNPVQEMKSDQLQTLYKSMRDMLEAD